MDQNAVSSREAFEDSYDIVGMAVHRAGAFRLTDVQSAGIHWLWPGRIPLGYLTLLVSDPGVGKSLLSLDIAARVSTGRPWPDETVEGQEPRVEGQNSASASASASGSGSPLLTLSSRLTDSASGSRPSTLDARPAASVLLINVEDHFATTVRPRLESLGADCSRIVGLSHVPGEGAFTMPRPVAIDRDINRLAILIRELPDCRLIILDPITAFFGDTTTRSTGNIWKVLSNLSWLAASADLAVLAISHLRKKEGAAIHRALGSLAFVAASRAAWTIAKDPIDSNKRLLLPLKNNLASAAKGLAFTIATDETTRAPVIQWLPGVVEASADTLLASSRFVGRPDDERKYAVEWLRARLSQCASPMRDIRNDAEAHGIGYGTLRRAFRELGAQAVKQGEAKYGQWTWKLPGQGAQNTQGEFCAP